MSRMKKSSPVLEAARHRLAGLKSINPAPDFGPELKIEDFESEISECDQSLSDYNTLNSTIGAKLADVRTREKALRVKNKRMLAATSARYGPDSKEFAQVGGTRDSERKAPIRKPPATK